MARAVYVRLKLHAFFREFPKGGEAEDLKAAAIGQNSAIPGHELMQTAKLIDQQVGRTQIEMISIAENNPCAEFFQHLLGQSLNRTLCTDRHKGRRFDNSVRSGNTPGSRQRFRIFSNYFKRKLFLHFCSVGLYPGRARTFAPGLETFTSM